MIDKNGHALSIGDWVKFRPSEKFQIYFGEIVGTWQGQEFNKVGVCVRVINYPHPPQKDGTWHMYDASMTFLTKEQLLLELLENA